MNRREFLEMTLAGSGALACPLLISGCSGADSRPPGPESNLLTGSSSWEMPFMDWYGIDEQTINRVMSTLTSRGADLADVYFQHSNSNSIMYEDGIVSQAQSSIDHGVGLRVVVGDSTGYAFTEDLTLDSMLQAAGTAASIAQSGGLALPQEYRLVTTPNYYPLGRPWTAVGIEQKLPIIERLAAMASAADPAVEKVIVNWFDQQQSVIIGDMEGRVVRDERPMTGLICTIIAMRDGERQSSTANLSTRDGLDFYTEERLEWLAQRAVNRTLVLFDARRPPAGAMPLVLDAGASGILLHEAIGHGMEADFNRKGISIYADKIGEPIAPDFVTIVDDGTQPHQRGALNVDDEGTLCERTVLVENGILKSYLHDKISAAHYGVASTGSGRRQSFRHAPLPRMRSTYMENGPHTREEIIASVQRGIMAETFLGGQVQIGAGDFTFYIKNGWLIEDGRISAPIKDCNLIGNGPEVLRNVSMVGDDFALDNGGWTCGKGGQSVPVSLGLPTVLVSEIIVGGENA